MKLLALAALFLIGTSQVEDQEVLQSSTILTSESGSSPQTYIKRPRPGRPIPPIPPIKPVDKCPTMRCMFGCKNSKCVNDYDYWPVKPPVIIPPVIIPPVVDPPVFKPPVIKPPVISPPGCKPCPRGQYCIAVACPLNS